MVIFEDNSLHFAWNWEACSSNTGCSSGCFVKQGGGGGRGAQTVFCWIAVELSYGAGSVALFL